MSLVGGEEALPANIDIAAIYGRHAQTVYRVCYAYLGSSADAEDAMQATFMRLLNHPRDFGSEEHEKAWLIVVASNLCKDVLKSSFRRRVVELPEYELSDSRDGELSSDLRDAVVRLPRRYRVPVYLYYYEGYKTADIAAMLGENPSTIRNRLADARKRLRRGWEVCNRAE